MSGTFEAYLESRRPGADTLIQAARFYLAEETDDLPPEEMRQQLVVKLGAEEQVDALARELETNPEALENAALVLLANAWEEPGGAERVTNVIESADKSLPVLEVGILSFTAMYITYLLVTRGVKLERRTIERRADGTHKETTVRELYGPTGPLAQLGKLFGLSGEVKSGANEGSR